MSGWKVGVLIDVHTRLPLSMKVVQIQEYEGRWLLPLLEQAQRNLGTRGHISTIVIDRGYLDDEDLWQVQKLGVLFVVGGKTKMAVAQGAQALAEGERGRVRLGRFPKKTEAAVVVHCHFTFGIFHLAELAVLTGVRLHCLPSPLGSRQTTLQRYGISP